VGLDLPYLRRASHDSCLKDRDVEEVEDRKIISSTIYKEKNIF